MIKKEVFQSIKYADTNLPLVDALVLQFPLTNGFVSALMLLYRVSIGFIFWEEHDQTNCARMDACMAHHFVFQYCFHVGHPRHAQLSHRKMRKRKHSRDHFQLQ